MFISSVRPPFFYGRSPTYSVYFKGNLWTSLYHSALTTGQVTDFRTCICLLICDIGQLSSIHVYVKQNLCLTVTPLGGHSACNICWHAQSMLRIFAIFGRAPLFYGRSTCFHPYLPSIQVQRLKITEYHFEVNVKDTGNPIRRENVSISSSSSMCQWISCTKWNSNDSRLEYTKINRLHRHFWHLIQTNRKGKNRHGTSFFWQMPIGSPLL